MTTELVIEFDSDTVLADPIGTRDNTGILIYTLTGGRGPIGPEGPQGEAGAAGAGSYQDVWRTGNRNATEASTGQVIFMASVDVIDMICIHKNANNGFDWSQVIQNLEVDDSIYIQVTNDASVSAKLNITGTPEWRPASQCFRIPVERTSEWPQGTEPPANKSVIVAFTKKPVAGPKGDKGDQGDSIIIQVATSKAAFDAAVPLANELWVLQYV